MEEMFLQQKKIYLLQLKVKILNGQICMKEWLLRQKKLKKKVSQN